MIQMLGAIAPLAKILFNTIEKSVPDKDLQEKLKADLQRKMVSNYKQGGVAKGCGGVLDNRRKVTKKY